MGRGGGAWADVATSASFMEMNAGSMRHRTSQAADAPAGERECVVVWTGPQAQPDYVDGVVQPKHTATACLYDIDDTWIGEFWQKLAAEGRTV